MPEFLSRRLGIGAIVLLFFGTTGEMRAAPPDGFPRQEKPSSIAELVEQLKQDDYLTRCQAADSLAALGPGAEPAIPALIDALGNGNQVQWKASRVLLVIGPPSVPALVAADKGHSNPEVRSQAFCVLGLMGREAQAALPVLQASLGRKTDRVVAVYRLRQIDPEGAFYLPTLVPGTKQPIPTLIDSLRDPDAIQQALAADVLSKIGPVAKQAIPALLELLKHKDAGVRAVAATALGSMGPEAESAIKPLLRALQDGNWFVRRQSAAALPRIAPRNREVALALARLLTDSTDNARRSAAEALERMGPGAEAAVRALSEALQDSTAGNAAATALGKIGPAARAAVPALIQAMKDADAQYAVIVALGRIGPDAQAAIPALIKAIEDKGELVPPAAVESLARIGPAAIPPLTAVLREGQPAVRMRAAETLGRIGSAAKAALPALSEALQDANASVRVEAAQALWRISRRTESLLPVLLEALKSDRQAAERAGNALVAIWALGAMEAEAELAVPNLIAALGDEDAVVRMLVASVLGQIGPGARSAVLALKRALADAKADVRATAAFALGQIGPEARPAVPALVNLLADPDPIVRWASLTALRMLGPAAKEAVPALARLVQDRRGCIWQAPNGPHFLRTGATTRWITGVEGQDLIPAQAAFRKERPVPVAELACGVLAEIGPAARDATPALLTACQEERVSVRLAAVAALKKINPEALARAQPSARQLQALWTDLADSDEKKAYHAAWSLILAPKQTLPWLRQRLRPAAVPDAGRVARLIRELNHDEFAIRDKARSELEALGELAGPALTQALADKPALEVRKRIEDLLQRIEEEVPVPEQIRALRCLSVLEKIGSPEAQDLLRALSQGAAGAGLTRQAREALGRLAQSPTAP